MFWLLEVAILVSSKVNGIHLYRAVKSQGFFFCNRLVCVSARTDTFSQAGWQREGRKVDTKASPLAKAQGPCLGINQSINTFSAFLPALQFERGDFRMRCWPSLKCCHGIENKAHWSMLLSASLHSFTNESTCELLFCMHDNYLLCFLDLSIIACQEKGDCSCLEEAM